MSYNIVFTPSSEKKYKKLVRKQCPCPYGGELLNWADYGGRKRTETLWKIFDQTSHNEKAF